MLREIRIRNYALIDELALEFGPGLNVITGETGAGKTILFDALALALGGKTSRPAVREGAECAFVQCLFDIAPGEGFPGADYVDEEGVLLLERKIPRAGRGRVEANGRLIPLERLREWGGRLVDFHGQQEKESLVRRPSQRNYLDVYGGCTPAVEAFRVAIDAARAAKAALDEEAARINALREKEDFLRWQLCEIGGAGLVSGEEEELDERRRILQEAEKLAEAVFHARESLREGERSAVELIGEVAEKLGRFDGHGTEAIDAAKACERALAEIEEALSAVDRLAGRIDAPPGELERIVERLEEIAVLRRKYRRTVDEILEYRAEAEAELEQIESGDEALRLLAEEAEKRNAAAARLAVKLSALRKKKGTELSKKVEKGIAALAFRGARFEVRLDRTADPDGELEIDGVRWRADRGGIDTVEFLLAANRGEPLLPLRKVASGGELSRVMLALKRVLADEAQLPTALFDEIDAGVGGDVAERIGDALRDVSRGRQVLCITHFPSIASLADRHIRVEKRMLSHRVVIRASILDTEERVEELVRMMGGDSRRAVSVPHAEEILRSGKGGPGAA